MERGGDRYYYHYDGRGSISALTDANGHKNQAYTYEPYGRLVTEVTGGVDQPFRWNSEYALNDYDYKIGARWYDASLGRWTQRDPSGQDPNPYAFGENDPINKVDPSGLFSLDFEIEGCYVVCAKIGVTHGEDGGNRLFVGAGVGSPGATGGVSVSSDDGNDGGLSSYGGCAAGPVNASGSIDKDGGSLATGTGTSWSSGECSAGYQYTF